ncbi:MAG: DUF2157 domain-containing protein [Actinobacteria bacterium]|nr:DUF2157 domain-containing protein [Actinomycetota bacterium]
MTASGRLPAPVERAWRVLVDWERQAQWMLDADSVRVVGDVREGVGTRVAVRTRLFGIPLFTEVLEVTAWDPPSGLEVAHSGLVRGTGRWRLDPDQGGARFTWEEDVRLAVPLVGGLAARLYAPFMRRLMRRAIAGLARSLTDSAAMSPTNGPASADPAAEGADLERWVDAKLISPQQAAAIRAYERGDRAPARRGSLVSEALGYVGAALALAGLVAALGRVWNDLDPLARVAILAVAGVIFLAAGAVARTSDEPAFDRLSSVLWAVSAGLAAWALSEGFQDDGGTGETTALLTALASFAYSGFLWRVQPRTLQQIPMFLSALAVVTLALALLPVGRGPEALAIAFIVLGGGWLLASHAGAVAPEETGLMLGAVLLLIAPATPAAETGVFFLVAFVICGGLMAAGVAWEHLSLLAVGTAGTFAYLTWAVVEYFGDSLGVPLALSIAGGLVLAVALLATRLRRGITPDVR